MSGHKISLDVESFPGETPFSPLGKEETAGPHIEALQEYEDALILIVDDDPEICKFLQDAISQWGLKVETITSPLKVVDRVSNNSYNLVLLDVVMPGKSGMDLLPEIVDLCPDTKVIIMTGYADLENAIRSLKLGAFDFLEKPFRLPLLRHSLKRALDAQKTELDYKRTREDLEDTLNNLMTHRSKSEQLNRELMETNGALSVLVRNIDRTRRETGKEIILKIRSLIIPVIEKLQRASNFADYRSELVMLSSYVEDLTSEMASDTEIATVLTPAELRIASLIKNGLSSEEIADHLCIAACTVKTHRRNMRKKLTLDNSKHSLRNYLQSNLGD
jgi:FixJ family two-component response regulator